MSLQTQGQIITFYSYKGGTGRTMALANVACLLARRQIAETAKASSQKIGVNATQTLYKKQKILNIYIY